MLAPVLVPADEAPSYPSVNPKYDFTWQVSDDYSNNNYGQKESRDGASTVGSYFVNLPDGRTQKVAYTVDAYGGKYFQIGMYVLMYEFPIRCSGRSQPRIFLTLILI